MSRRKIKKNRTSEMKSYSVRMGFGGNGVMEDPVFTQVAPRDYKWLSIYINSHDLLPPFWVFDGSSKSMEKVDEAVDTLLNMRGGDEDILRALVLLGHSPCPLAVKTLDKCVLMDHPYNRIARHALDECLTMIQTPPPGFAGVSGMVC